MNLRRLAAILLIPLSCGASSLEAAEPTLAEEAAFRAAVNRVADAVVRVEPAGASEKSLLAGSEANPGGGPSTGLVVAADAAAAGWILTTSFAVPQDVTDAVVVLADGKRLATKVAGRDLSRGLVLLKSDPLPAVPAVEPASRRELAPGQWTIAVGRGWGHAAPAVSVGILSAVSRSWGRAVQTDASVSPANYGGPLVDIEGRVIGILAPLPADTAGLNLGTELYDSGIGFAVPLEDVLRVLPRLQAGESLSLGIFGLVYRSADQINGEPVIASCRQGSPAAKAGLRAGDRIVKVGDRDVVRIADARHEIAPRYAGDEIAVTFERRIGAGDPERIEVRATLTDRLPPWRAAAIGVLPVPVAGGGTPRSLKVAWVLPGGPASKAGVVAGDLIESITASGAEPLAERTIVDSPAALAGFLTGVEPGSSVALGLVREGKPMAMTVATATALAEVPADGGGDTATADDPLAGAIDAATIVKLQAAEVAKPPLAVIPRAGGDEPVGVLIFFGPPHGPVTEAEAAAWKAAAARHGIAIILPGSDDPQRWSTDDVPAVRRALGALNGKRPVDPARIAVAGRAAGGSFAWLVAERLGAAVRGVAVIDAALPRQAAVEPMEPGRSRWVLLSSGTDEGDLARRLAADRRRLEAAGFPVGTVVAEGDATPTDFLCRWVSILGLL
jgi:serine protease Do